MDSKPTTYAAVADRPFFEASDIAEKTAFEREIQPGRIGKKHRDPLRNYTEEDVYNFLAYLDKLWRRLSERVKETVDEFDNWNKWFKKEKKKPPTVDKNKVVYLREEFNAKRSPHLWKSNPNRKWVLSFGNNPINNIVSAILYKYQNETISKDA